jgi:hypothetical protein
VNFNENSSSEEVHDENHLPPIKIDHSKELSDKKSIIKNNESRKEKVPLIPLKGKNNNNILKSDDSSNLSTPLSGNSTNTPTGDILPPSRALEIYNVFTILYCFYFKILYF